MKRIPTCLMLLTSLVGHAQADEKFNLGFEKQQVKTSLSDGWLKWGTYDLTIESDAHSGMKSGKVTSTDNGGFGSIAYKIPANYKGKTIQLEGYMKIKNVENGTTLV